MNAGADPANRTTINVAGNVDNVSLGGPAGRPDNVALHITGDLTNSRVTLGDCEVTIDGDLLGENQLGEWFLISGAGTIDVLGDCSGAYLNLNSIDPDVMTMTVGSGGGPNGETPLEILWYLIGKSVLIVEGDYTGDDGPDFKAIVRIRQDTLMEVHGNTVGAAWPMDGNGVFEADEVGTKITGGVWILNDASRVVGRKVEHGVWVVRSAGTNGLRVTTLLAPDDLIVDGGLALCDSLGVLATDPFPATIPWNLTFDTDGTVTVTEMAWHAGIVDGHAVNSILTYTGPGNTYTTAELYLNGEIQQGPFGVLSISVTGEVEVQSQIVRIDGGGNTVTIPFETDGITLNITEQPCAAPATLEVFAPDYKGGAVDYNPDNVMFSDSVCVHKWQKVTVTDNGAGACVQLQDEDCSTPISGGADAAPGCGLPEALYASRISVPSNTALHTGSLNIYYTGAINSAGIVGNTPIQLTETLYGDFDGDAQAADIDDQNRFTAAYCTCNGDPDYDPLVDWDCDGDVDAVDLNQMVTNWGPFSTDPGPCADACP